MPKNKNEIDKEMMYRKIMPTSVRPMQSAVPGSAAQVDGASSAAAISDQKKSPSEVSSAMTAYTQPLIKKNASGVRLRESQNMVLVNVMEELVVSKLDTTLMRFNCCKCNKCKKDIAAIALNRLPAKYIVIDENDTAKRKEAEDKYASDVTGALVQAILAVKKEPRH